MGMMLAVVVPGMLRIGGVRVPVYSLFVVGGVIVALVMSEHTAKLAGLDRDKVWDAGVSAVVAAIVASRVLLVAVEFRELLHYPLIVLATPSWTYGGMALTALLLVVYLRWKRLPLLRVMDAWAPSACLLAAILAVGHFIEGTDAGMPTSLPWGVVTAGDSILGRVHPVQLYEAVVALVLGAVVLRLLRGDERPVGLAAGIALFAGGVAEFLLGMLRQPMETQGGAWLDPAQYGALVAIGLGGYVLGTTSLRGSSAERLQQLG